MKISANAIQTITKHKKAPRYLYHFTTENHLNEIKNSKILKANIDGSSDFLGGVFMVDMQNFVKNWNKFFIIDDISILTCLFAHISGNSKKIACLKVPTANLKNDIIIRSQENLIKRFSNNKNQAESVKEIFSKVDKYKLYQRNNHSIEYIHQGDIPLKDVEIVGVQKIPTRLKKFFSDFSKTYTSEIKGKDANNDALELLKSFFSGKPESKAFK